MKNTLILLVVITVSSNFLLAEEFVQVECLNQWAKPQIISGAYSNVVFSLSYDIFERESGPGCISRGGWIAKRIDPLPEVFPDFDTICVTQVNTFEHFFDSTAGLEREIFDGEVSMLFSFPGTYLFRWGFVWDLPYPYTIEEAWDWMEGDKGVCDDAQVTFDFGVPDAEFHIVQPCPEDWLPVIEGFID